MKTATLVRELEDFSGRAALYKLSDPLPNWRDSDDPEYARYEFVVVSAATVAVSGPETYIFGSNEKGEIVSWSELPGSARGTLSHSEALSDAGYQLD